MEGIVPMTWLTPSAHHYVCRYALRSDHQRQNKDRKCNKRLFGLPALMGDICSGKVRRGVPRLLRARECMISCARDRLDRFNSQIARCISTRIRFQIVVSAL